ncbi:MAG: hypothetical protein LBG05_09055 [Treponema sp.]|jgi:hypothetical protein|nr:hypothetical protein [Treponema sp.]
MFYSLKPSPRRAVLVFEVCHFKHDTVQAVLFQDEFFKSQRCQTPIRHQRVSDTTSPHIAFATKQVSDTSRVKRCLTPRRNKKGRLILGMSRPLCILTPIN